MIDDLGHTLYNILTQPGLPAELAAAQVVFDRPTDKFAPSATTIDLFLYDIRENLELRNNQPIIQRQNGSTSTVSPPLRVACSYLITAWPVGGTDLALQEHGLLSQVLQVFAALPTIPPKFLAGSLVGQDPPMPVVSAQSDVLRSPGEFWTALGTQWWASISLTVTISMTVSQPATAPTVITQEVRLGERTSSTVETLASGTVDDSFQIGGTVTGATSAPVVNATVELVEVGLSTVTDTTGHYTLGWIIAGKYTLSVTPSGGKAETFPITVPVVSGMSTSNYNVRLT